MKTTLTFGWLLLASIAAFAQPAANYNIDTDGDGFSDGVLYRDEVYTSGGDLVFFSDYLAGPGGFTYSTGVELYNGDTTDLRLDVYYADYGTDTIAAKDKPVIFFFYGGGFSTGTSVRVKDLCIQYAARGYVAVAPNYRLGYYGAYESDSVDICDNLKSVAQAPYRAMLDAQAAMRWMRDNAASAIGLDISADHFFVHGPSFFPLLSHMQSDEVPSALAAIGQLDDSIKIRASVGRSAGMNLTDLFIDADDTAPFLIFQGTCDKSVPFTKFSLGSRFGCDTIVGGSIPGDNTIFGSYLITQQVNHYYEYYPICGLHHSLKNIEENEMREPVAEFLYNMTVDNILPTDAPITEPYIVASCDVNGQCKGEDRFGWCFGATELPPNDGTCLRVGLGESRDGRSEERVSNETSMMVFPNPTRGPITLTLDATEAGASVVQVFDAFGRLRYQEQIQVQVGLNVQRMQLPTSLETGVYVLQVDGVPGPRFLKQ